MAKLDLKTFVLGELANNCYLIFNRESKNSFVIDCPLPTQELDKFIRENNLEISFIALTHGHFDHISGLDNYSVPFYVHKKDILFLKDSRFNGSLFFSSPITVKREPLVYEEKNPLYFEKERIEIIHTPGHTPGSVTLKLNNWIFTGDALFYDSIGRTDVPFGSSAELIKAIRRKILTLPPEIIVYPGHGPSTTVGREKADNPFLQGADK
jgi:glyoxylase-like metal-dependent hydrolase (beta-lactamase superfamily II)